MRETYAGDPDADWADLTIPDDGDQRDAASVDVALETLADRTAYLKALRHPGAYLEWLSTAQYNSDDWGTSINTGLSGKGGWVTGVASAPLIVFPIDIPDGSKINDIWVYIEPPGAHSALPAGMPFWELYETDPVAGTTTQLLTANDASGSVGAYQTRHYVSRTSQNVPTTRAKMYHLVFHGEGSTHALPNLRVHGVAVQFTMTNLDPRGA